MFLSCSVPNPTKSPWQLGVCPLPEEVSQEGFRWPGWLRDTLLQCWVTWGHIPALGVSGMQCWVTWGHGPAVLGDLGTLSCSTDCSPEPRLGWQWPCHGSLCPCAGSLSLAVTWSPPPPPWDELQLCLWQCPLGPRDTVPSQLPSSPNPLGMAAPGAPAGPRHWQVTQPSPPV